jgi:hypothetical protein
MRVLLGELSIVLYRREQSCQQENLREKEALRVLYLLGCITYKLNLWYRQVTKNL